MVLALIAAFDLAPRFGQRTSLDELPEFKRTVLEVMRQPLEDRKICISRAKFAIEYPASFMLVSSMNPCPCGFWNDPTRECRCTPLQIQRYVGRISGPLLDRIDIHVEVPRVDYEKLSDSRLGEPAATVRTRVEVARELQRARFDGAATQLVNTPHITCNADMRPAEVRKFCALDDTSRSLMKSAMSQLQLSARAYHRILKLARTIADLAGAENIGPAHLAEALQYRPRGMMAG